MKERSQIRRQAWSIIRNANRATQQAAMALAYLNAEGQSFDALAADVMQAALYDLETAIKSCEDL